jgi:hypothetical protein
MISATLSNKSNFICPSGLGKRWDETINRRFVRTLDQKEWLPRIRALGPCLALMTQVQLYAEDQLDDEVIHGNMAETKEASLAARIGGKAETAANVDDAIKGSNIELLNRSPLMDMSTTDVDLPQSTSDPKKRKRGRITANVNSAPGLAMWRTTATNSRLSRLNKD